MSRVLRGWLLFLSGASLGSALIFLYASDLFSRWDGPVSLVPSREEEASYQTVRIVSDDRVIQRSWRTSLVESLSLREASSGGESSGAAMTKKSRYTLHALVKAADPAADWVVVPTTSPTALGLGLLTFAGLLALRNMTVSGVPWRLSPAERYRPVKLTPSGQAAKVDAPPPSKKAPLAPRPKTGPRLRGRR